MAANNSKKIKRKVRNAYIVSTVSIALVLFLLGSVGYLIMGALGATEQLQMKVTVYVMLRDDATPESVAAIQEKLSARPEVHEVKYVSKEEAAAEFQNYQQDDFVAFLGYNPLPNSYEVKLNAHRSDKATLSALERDLLSWGGVEEVVYQRNVVDKISANIDKFNMALLLFGGTLLFISLILLNNTIRLTIFSKRYIINTMKLVGATRGFIMRPFLVSSIWQGIYAGLISWGLITLLILGLSEKLPEVRFLSDQIYLVVIYGAMLVGGVLISFIFTAFSVRKYLRMNSSQINVY